MVKSSGPCTCVASSNPGCAVAFDANYKKLTNSISLLDFYAVRKVAITW